MRCRRPLSALALLAVITLTAGGQPPPPAKDGKLVIAAAVSPAAPPLPALKYLFLPDLREKQTGNQVPAFYKCFFEQNYFYFDKDSVANRERWLTAPLAELAGEQALVGYGGSSLRQADYAARLDSIDWQITNQLRSDGFNTLLPDVQQLRMLASALKVKMRGQVARKEYDGAARTAATLFALARTFNDHPTLIGNLVGLAITSLTLQAVEEMCQQPDAPNLFWAFAALPDPFIDLNTGLQGERGWAERDFGALRKAEPVGKDELARMVKKLDEIIKLEGGGRGERSSDWHEGLAADPAVLAASKARLAKAGYKPAALDKLDRLQVFLMDDYHQYETFRDDMLKWSNVPYHRLPPEVDGGKSPPGPFNALAPNWRKVRTAQLRVQQWIGLLQAVEAVRAYAAANGGALPPSLEATGLPVPNDPFTGRPFPYEVKDGTAVIRGTPPADRKADPNFNRVYEVTIRK
ncbi:MAG: hypothetical protein K2X87_30700 [Gemmataceae bacterium]|nr:hypothetical protein [Gemmataceae bacterium]